MHFLNCNGKIVNLSRPHTMAILNLSSDSFYSSSYAENLKDILKKTEAYVNEGADIIDIGIASTRPNSKAIGSQMELQRLGKCIEALHKEFPEAILSIDSYEAETVKAALNQGANIVNDVSGNGHNNGLADLAIEFAAPYVLMDNPSPLHQPQIIAKDNSLSALVKRLQLKRQALLDKGLKDIIIDPGFGFGKSTKDSYHILKNIKTLELLHSPILVALSRKRFVCETIGKTADEAGMASSFLNAFAAQNGANIIRTHDCGMFNEMQKMNAFLG